MAKKTGLPQEFLNRLEFANLSEEEKEALLAKAEKQVQDDEKAAAAEKFLDAAKQHVRRRFRPDEALDDVLIDLPGHAVRLLIDGVEYIHGFTYRVTAVQARSMREQVQRCWNHEDEVGGANRNFYQRPRNLRIGPNSVNVPNSRLLGV